MAFVTHYQNACPASFRLPSISSRTPALLSLAPREPVCFGSSRRRSKYTLTPANPPEQFIVLLGTAYVLLVGPTFQLGLANVPGQCSVWLSATCTLYGPRRPRLAALVTADHLACGLPMCVPQSLIRGGDCKESSLTG